MQYLYDVPFSVPLGGRAFGEGWERTFGRKDAKPNVMMSPTDIRNQQEAERLAPCPCESGRVFAECHGQEAE